MMLTNARLPEETVIELVRSLFATLSPTIIMAVSFLTIGILIVNDCRSSVVAALVVMGVIAAFGRIAILLIYRAKARDAFLDLRSARELEGRFAATYISFAAVFGGFCATAFMTASADARTLTIGLLIGYGAGVAAGLGLRPWISVPSIVIATMPTIVAALLVPGTMHKAVGFLLAILLAGGVQAMLLRYRVTVAEIMMRRSFSTLARRDHLTGLLNRLSLREHFDEFAEAAGGANIIAVHCLDLDRFKPVNDRFGHPVGDALLRAVADRIMSALEEFDFAARTGGDEFVVVQTRASGPIEVSALATRLVAAIATQFVIEGHEIHIATSVGYILSSEYGTDLDVLVSCADEALCDVKRSGGGVRRYDAQMARPKATSALLVAA